MKRFFRVCSSRVVLLAGSVALLYVIGYLALRALRTKPRTSEGENIIVLKVWDLPFSNTIEYIYTPVAEWEADRKQMPIYIYTMNPDKRGAQNLGDGWGWDYKPEVRSYSP